MRHILSSLFIVILFLMLFPTFMYSADVNQLVTELKVFDNDTTFRYTYLYDGDGKKVLETKYYLQTNFWNRISQSEWVYVSGNCTHQTERIWKNNEWLNSYNIDFNYTDGVLSSEIHSIFNNKVSQQTKKVVYQYDASLLTSKKEYSTNSSVWALELETDFFYTKTSQLDSVITSTFQSENATSQFSFKNSYNSDGLISSQVQQEIDSNAVWVNTQLVNWYYIPGTTQLFSQRVKNWNSENSVWENYQRTDYGYNDNNQLISETYQYWKSMAWNSDLLYEYFYDTNENEIKKMLSRPIYHEWRGLISIIYSDFTKNKANLMESKYEFWGGTTGDLVTSFIPFNFNNETAIKKGKSIQISYLTPTDSIQSIPEISGSSNTICVYPNPSDGIYYINTQDYGVQSWIVSSLDGQMLKAHTQSIGSGVIDITELPKGIYILKVKTLTALLTQKLIKK